MMVTATVFNCYIKTVYNPALHVGSFQTKEEAERYLRGSISGFIREEADAHR